MPCLSVAVFDGVLADDANITPSADQQIQQQEDDMSLVTEDESSATCKPDEPSVQCLATDLLSAWQSLKVSSHLTFTSHHIKDYL